jgi:hypothetical protein
MFLLLEDVYDEGMNAIPSVAIELLNRSSAEQRV